MIGAELLTQIDERLNQITGHYNINFGGLDVIFIEYYQKLVKKFEKKLQGV